MTSLRGLSEQLQFYVGESVNAVHFVMDYVEIHFNGSYLRCLEPPTVIRGQAAFTFPHPGSRDALCGLIELVVSRVDAVEDQECRIAFASGEQLLISLARPTRVGAEALHFFELGQSTFGVV